jgi:hypothetical protein
VAGNDSKKVIDWNKEALNQLGSEKKKLTIVPPIYLKNQEL